MLHVCNVLALKVALFNLCEIASQLTNVFGLARANELRQPFVRSLGEAFCVFGDKVIGGAGFGAAAYLLLSAFVATTSSAARLRRVSDI